MKFQQLGRVNPEMQYKIKPLELAENVILKRLDFLLGFLKERNTEMHTAFIDQLKSTIKSLIGSFKIPKEKLDISEKLSEFTHINQYKKLVELHLHLLSMLLERPLEDVFSSEELMIPSKNYWLIVFGIRYYQILALTEIMDREEAIELFKEYIDQYYVFVESTFTKYETIDEMRVDHLKEVGSGSDMEFDVVASTVENGMYIIRNNNCPAIDAMKDFEDKELVYVTCCHGDFQYAVMSNEHFVMTREFTIAEGDPFCDKVFHDTRIDKEVKHPSKEFLDSMGPILKKNKTEKR